MTSMLAKVNQVEVQSLREHEKEQLVREFCATFGFKRAQMLAIPEMMANYARLEETVARLERQLDGSQAHGCDTTKVQKRCDDIWAVARRACCPGNILHSQFTLDQLSDEHKVKLSEIVEMTGFESAFPLEAGKAIRLEQLVRPGYIPEKIVVDLTFDNKGTNYADIEITFWLGPGGSTRGTRIGPTWDGSEFLETDGSKLEVRFPTYRGQPHEVGAMERLAVEIRHTGNTNKLISAKVRLPVDDEHWFEQCATQECP